VYGAPQQFPPDGKKSASPIDGTASVPTTPNARMASCVAIVRFMVFLVLLKLPSF